MKTAAQVECCIPGGYSIQRHNLDHIIGPTTPGIFVQFELQGRKDAVEDGFQYVEFGVHGCPFLSDIPIDDTIYIELPASRNRFVN